MVEEVLGPAVEAAGGDQILLGAWGKAACGAVEVDFVGVPHGSFVAGEVGLLAGGVDNVLHVLFAAAGFVFVNCVCF